MKIFKKVKNNSKMFIILSTGITVAVITHMLGFDMKLVEKIEGHSNKDRD